MLLTDWPLGVLSKFWADHSVLSAVLSSLLLVGVGFLAFEVHDTRVQSELDDNVTAAGMGGIVDHVVDIEVALTLASAPKPPDPVQWGDWSANGRPLRWLRDRRELLNRAEAGGPSATDPRRHEPPGQLADGADSWRTDLLDQCVRRVIAALRDWAPVLGRSRNGQAALVDLGKLRNELLKVQAALVAGAYIRGVPNNGARAGLSRHRPRLGDAQRGRATPSRGTANYGAVQRQRPIRKLARADQSQARARHLEERAGTSRKLPDSRTRSGA